MLAIIVVYNCKINNNNYTLIIVYFYEFYEWSFHDEIWCFATIKNLSGVMNVYVKKIGNFEWDNHKWDVGEIMFWWKS